MSKQKTLADTYFSGCINDDPYQDKQIPDDDLIIFPTTLLSNQYKKELIAQNISHNPDLITTLHDFCRKYHDQHGKKTRVISDGQARLILSITLDRIKSDIPFFFSHGNPSAGTIKDLFILRTIISQRSIDFSSHTLVIKSEKCRQISQALAAYERNLSESQLLDSSALIEWTISDIISSPEILFGRVKIHRLQDLLSREKELLVAIRNHAKTFSFEYLAGKDPAIFSPPDWVKPEELFPIRPTPEPEDRSGFFTSTSDKHNDIHLQTRVFSSATEEFESIAEEIHSLAQEGVLLEDIAIAYPVISSVLSSLQEVLDDFGIPYYSYSGEPLIREPIIGFLFQFLSLVAEAYPRENVINLISSPYFNIRQQNLPTISIAEFDLVARTAGIDDNQSWDELLNLLQSHPEDNDHHLSHIPDKVINDVLCWITEIQQDFNQFTDKLTPAGYAAVFHQLCKRWMQPEFREHKTETDNPVISREKLAFNKFQGCLTMISSLFNQNETIDIQRYRRFLLYLIEEPVNLTMDNGGVRIMGLRQTAGMYYPHLFLGGLVEGDIPSPSTRLPLLTSQESEQLGSRGLNEVVREEQYYFLSAIEAGKTVRLSAPKTRGEKKILTSSFFEQVRRINISPEWGREISHSPGRAAIKAGRCIGRQRDSELCSFGALISWLPANQTYGSVATRILVEDWFRTGTPDSVYDGILTEDHEIADWLSGAEMFGPGRIWSPTQLETYAHCPFCFFLQRVIRADPLPDVDPTLSPARKGSLIHETLCSFYSHWCATGPRRVTGGDLSEASGILRKIGTEIIMKYRYQSPAWHATVASLLGYDGLPGLYERFILREAGNSGCLVPGEFELDIGTTPDLYDPKPAHVVLDPGEGEPVCIHGRIDRVDLTQDGCFAIIDYKTGNNYPNSRRISEGKALQLPLYLLALEKMHEEDEQPWIGIGASYLKMSRQIKQTWPLLDPEKKSVAGVPGRKSTTDFMQVKRAALVAAQQYITDIRNGIFPVTRDPCSILKYCPYSDICRFNRFRGVESASEGDE